MPDLDDIVQTLERLREVIDSRVQLIDRRVTGIEVTQSVQYYDSASHLTDPADRAADNAVTLVAYKPAVVRAYVRPVFGATVDKPVGGTLLIERKQGIVGPWKEVATLAPWLSSRVTPVADSYDDERRSLWQSLNFRIPASQFVGYMRLTLTLDTGETRQTTVSAYLVQTLRVRIIPVSYSGPSTSSPAPGTVPPTLTLAPPTLADAQTSAALAFRMMPVQQTGSFASTSSLAWSLPLDDPRTGPGGCSVNWGSLLTALGSMRDNDGNRADVVYYGLLPTGIPLNVPGCGYEGLGSGAVGDTMTFVHEIGHGYGFRHTPSGNVGDPDPNYPVYEPYFSASIGEYGLDVQSGAVFSPATSTDYMSYGPNRWMSLYQHARLIEHGRLAPTWVREKSPLDDIPVEFDPEDLWWPNPPWKSDLEERYAVNPLISVRGIIDETGTVRVDSVARIVANPLMHGPELSWSAQLVGESGEVAARVRMTRVLEHGGEACGCAPGPFEGNPDQLPLQFHAMIPDAEPGRALRILDRRGEEVWARRAPDEPVRFTGMEAEIAGDKTVRFGWDVRTDVEPDVWAQYSADGGETWRGLTIGLRDGRGEVGVDGMPRGPVLVRLLAHDGFFTAASDPVEVEVPERAPFAAILYPSDGEAVVANTDIEVLGSAVDQAGDPIDDDHLEWAIDGRRFARGRAAVLRVEPGEHELTFRAAARRDAGVSVRFTARRVE